MRKWSSATVAAVVTALLLPSAAFSETPADVYSDFAEDGVLSCGHSKAALKGVLNDASIYQHGDPLTFIGLKLAVRQQLAGGCRRNERSAAFFGSTTSTDTSADSGSAKPPRGKRMRQRNTGRSAAERQRESAVTEALSDRKDGRMLFLGVVLLLLTLGSGGWAARRAFSDES